MAIQIWPSANDIHGGTPGDGNKWLEQQGAAWIKAFYVQDFVVGGLTLPATDPDLTIEVSGGTAFIDGRTVVVGSPISVLCTANNTNHIYLKLIKDGGGNANDAQLEANITETAPADSVKIGTAVAGASAISATTDQRILEHAKPHRHLSASNGGLIGVESVGSAQIKLIARSFQTQNYNALNASSHTFTIPDIPPRMGDFSIEHDKANVGKTTLQQIQLVGVQTLSRTWELDIEANAFGSSGTRTTVRWNELDSVV